jgi:hypothetical protein
MTYGAGRRIAAKRDANELEIIDALERAGAQVTQLDSPVDLLVDYREEWHLLEVKVNERSKLTDRQQNFIEAHPWMVEVVWTPMMALKAIGAVNG